MKSARYALARGGAAGLLGILALFGANAAGAQDAKLGKDIWITKAPCKNCHGWGGHGIPDDPQAPAGFTLRGTKLTQAQIVEVILCGRPGSEMPYFDRNAYTDARCYGMTREQLGGMNIGQGSTTLTQREATALAIFIVSEFVGKGAPTFEECDAFWGAGAARCKEYPRAAR